MTISVLLGCEVVGLEKLSLDSRLNQSCWWPFDKTQGAISWRTRAGEQTNKRPGEYPGRLS